MSRTRLVGLVGYAGSGKTAAARELEALGFVRMRFADPIKSMVRALGLTEEQIDGDQKEVPLPHLGGRTPRYLMQTLGTEWGRQLVLPTLWVDVLKVRASASMNLGLSVVVDDVRFPNEEEAIRRLGGRLIRISRPEIPGRPASHPSEAFAGTLRVDHEIDNSGSLDDLHRALVGALNL